MATSFPNFIQILRRGLAAKGIALDPLLAQADLAELAKTNERLPLDITSKLWTIAEQASGDATLGLWLMKHVDITDFEELGIVLVSLTSPEHALQRMARYNRLASDAITLTPLSTNETIGVRFDVLAGAHWRSVEFAVAIITRLLRTRFGRDVGPASVAFAFDNPPGRSSYERYYRCPVTLGAKQSVVAFHRRDSDPEGVVRADLFSRFEPLLEARLSAIEATSTPWVDRVSSFVGPRLKDGEPSLDEAATALHVSTRTLQRHLSNEGKSFQVVLDDTRRQLATQWLARREMSLTQIGFLLGFSSSSAFSRAHKRWFGEAPSRASDRQENQDRKETKPRS